MLEGLGWLRLASAVAALLVGLFVGDAQPMAVGLFAPPWDKLAHAGVVGVAALTPLILYGC